MARIRTIKPEFWVSAQVAECSTNARLLFVGLWNFCDDQGVHPENLRQVKMEIFPGDSFDLPQIRGWINELLHVGLLKQFIVPFGSSETFEGQGFWWVTGWHHQRIDKPSNKYPNPAKFLEHSKNDSRNGIVPLEDHSLCIGKESIGKESIGKELSLSSGEDEKKKRKPRKPRHVVPYSPEFEDWWRQYPKHRREGKDKAAPAYSEALARIVANHAGMDYDQARGYLRQRTIEYAGSPAGNNGVYTPLPASWLNAGRFEDDPQSWNKNERTQKADPRGTFSAAESYLRKRAAEDEGPDAIDALCGPAGRSLLPAPNGSNFPGL